MATQRRGGGLSVCVCVLLANLVNCCINQVSVIYLPVQCMYVHKYTYMYIPYIHVCKFRLFSSVCMTCKYYTTACIIKLLSFNDLLCTLPLYILSVLPRGFWH